MRPPLDMQFVSMMLSCNLAGTSACQEAIAATGPHVLWLPGGGLVLNADAKCWLSLSGSLPVPCRCSTGVSAWWQQGRRSVEQSVQLCAAC